MYDHLKELAEQFLIDWPQIEAEGGQLSQSAQADEPGELFVKSRVIDFLYDAYKHGVRDSIRVLEIRASLPRSVAMNNEASKCITALGIKLLRDGGSP